MKKSSKIILGIVIVTLLLGIAGLTAGVAMGARPAEFLNVKVGGINLSLGDNPLFYDGIAFQCHLDKVFYDENSISYAVMH